MRILGHQEEEKNIIVNKKSQPFCCYGSIFSFSSRKRKQRTCPVKCHGKKNHNNGNYFFNKKHLVHNTINKKNTIKHKY